MSATLLPALPDGSGTICGHDVRIVGSARTADRAVTSYVLPWQLVTVVGQSMTPTLLPGDVVLVRHGGRITQGSLVLATFRSRPEVAVIKRAIGAADGGWLLGSDNARAGADSRQYGVADVAAVAGWMLPLSSARADRDAAAARRLLGVALRWWPRRIRPDDPLPG